MNYGDFFARVGERPEQERLRIYHYGLVGKTIRVRCNRRNEDGYPFCAHDLTVSVKVTGETPRLITGTVLPHSAPDGFGSSQPYPITINKVDLSKEEFEIWIGNEKVKPIREERV